MKHTPGSWPGYNDGSETSGLIQAKDVGAIGEGLKAQKPQLPLQQVICFLQLQTSELNLRLDRLRKRLSVLQRNQKPVPAAVAGDPCPPAESTVSTEIVDSAKRIRDLRYQVEELLESLEV